jgi:hypothetical protein
VSNRGKVSLMVGLVALGLSPSFVDWEQSPDLRWQIVAFYGVGLTLIAFGLWDGG